MGSAWQVHVTRRYATYGLGWRWKKYFASGIGITTSFGPRKMMPYGCFGHATLLHVYTTSRGR
eukprot:3165405-Prymnesium_polylepis.1